MLVVPLAYCHTVPGAAASGMTHNQNTLDVIGHNVANVNSYAYKKFRPLHEGLPTPQVDPDAGRLGVAETTRDLVFSQAATQITENPLHFAIEDDSFLRVQDFDGRIDMGHGARHAADVPGPVIDDDDVLAHARRVYHASPAGPVPVIPPLRGIPPAVDADVSRRSGTLRA